MKINDIVTFKNKDCKIIYIDEETGKLDVELLDLPVIYENVSETLLILKSNG